MVFHEDVSQLLFENSFILKEWVYIKLMNLLYENYKNRFDFSFAHFILKNKKDIDYIVLKKLFYLLEKEFSELNELYIQREKQNKIENEKQNEIKNEIENENKNYFDLKMIFTIIPIPIVIFCSFIYIL